MFNRGLNRGLLTQRHQVHLYVGASLHFKSRMK
jgi:hypothetical protein